ncbi:MAG TPA: M56 family metallopeptidase [Pirellulaceae bacterium]|nr:M56 family metallopeptidase [Pirellulaceae bacterium]
MDLLPRSADYFVHIAFWTVLHSLWQGAIFAAALAVWRRFADERDYAARSAAATLTLAFLAAAPLATAALLASSHVPPSEAVIEARFDLAELDWDASLVSPDAAAIAVEPTPALSSERLAARLPQAIAILWTIGVTCGCLRLLASATRLHLVRWQAKIADDDLMEKCRELARRYGLARPPRLLRSASARGPYAFGLLRPCIVVPAAWALETTPEALEAAVAHELAHLKRRDLWVLALQRLVETALFYHPGVWYVSRTLNVERERAADRLAAEVLGDPARYAESLYRLASLAGGPGSPALTLPFHGENRMKLLERVRDVLRTEETKAGGVASVGWLCLAPALLAAIFLGQAAFAGSLRADEGEREGATVAEDAEDDEPRGRGEESPRQKSEREKDNKERDGKAGNDQPGREEEAADDRGAGEFSHAEFRRQVEELNAQLETVLKEKAKALEEKYKAQMQSAQQDLARAMEELQTEAKEQKAQIDRQISKIIAARQEEAQRRAEAERSGQEKRETGQADVADDMTPREQRMMGIIRSLEAKVRTLESQLRRADERRTEEAPPRQDRREGERRSDGRGEDEGYGEGGSAGGEYGFPREKREEKEGASDRTQQGESHVQGDPNYLRLRPQSEEEAKERQFHSFAARLYAALRSDEMLDARKPEFVRRVFYDVFDAELTPDDIRIIIDRSSADPAEFRQAVAGISEHRRQK